MFKCDRCKKYQEKKVPYRAHLGIRKGMYGSGEKVFGMDLCEACFKELKPVFMLAKEEGQ